MHGHRGSTVGRALGTKLVELHESRVVPIVRALVDVLVPPQCVGCDAPGRYWCRTCASSLASPTAVAIPGLPPVWAAGRYEGAVVKAIKAWKEDGSTILEPLLAPALAHGVADAVGDWPAAGLGVVPVPPTAAALRRRGHDPMLSLATAAATRLAQLGRPTKVATCLAAARPRHDQSRLGVAERSRNMYRSMTLSSAAPPYVVVVDDIVTTGATLREVLRALSPHTHVLGCAVLAATAKRPAHSAGLPLDTGRGSARVDV